MSARTRLLLRSPIEARVRQVLDERREVYRAQYRIGPYRADFYLPGRRLVLECDGHAWHSRPEQRARDRARDAYMTERGFLVRRMTGKAIVRDTRQAVSWALRPRVTRKVPVRVQEGTNTVPSPGYQGGEV